MEGDGDGLGQISDDDEFSPETSQLERQKQVSVF
jgi:hypothetical protein